MKDHQYPTSEMQHMVPVPGFFPCRWGEKKLLLWMCKDGFNVFYLLTVPLPQCLSRTATEHSWALWVWSCTTWVHSWFLGTVTCPLVVRRVASSSLNFDFVFWTKPSMHHQVTNSKKVYSGAPAHRFFLNGFIKCFHPIKTDEKTYKTEWLKLLSIIFRLYTFVLATKPGSYISRLSVGVRNNTCNSSPPCSALQCSDVFTWVLASWEGNQKYTIYRERPLGLYNLFCSIQMLILLGSKRLLFILVFMQGFFAACCACLCYIQKKS